MLITNRSLVFSEEAEPEFNFRSIITTHDPTIQVDKTALPPDISIKSIVQHAYPNAIYLTAQCPGTANHQYAATRG
jgi:hypothetical protein